MEIRLHLPFALAWEEIAAKLRLDEDDGEDLRPYFEEAMRIANPKAAFCRVAVRVEDEKHVWLGDTRFESALMARNLAACKDVSLCSHFWTGIVRFVPERGRPHYALLAGIHCRERAAPRHGSRV